MPLLAHALLGLPPRGARQKDVVVRHAAKEEDFLVSSTANAEVPRLALVDGRLGMEAPSPLASLQVLAKPWQVGVGLGVCAVCRSVELLDFLENFKPTGWPTSVKPNLQGATM